MTISTEAHYELDAWPPGSPVRVSDLGANALAGTALTQITITATQVVPVGDYAFVFLGGGFVSATLNSVTDTRGHTWVIDENPASSTVPGIARTLVTTQIEIGDVFTLTVSAGQTRLAATAKRVEGVEAASPLDQKGGGSGTSATPAASTAATTQPDELVFGMLRVQGTSAASRIVKYGAGFDSTEGAIAASGSSSVELAVEYKIVTATGVQTADATLDQSSTWRVVVPTYVASQALAETGTLTIATSLSGVETTGEASFQSGVFAPSASEALGDSGAQLVVLSVSGTDAAADTGTNTVVVALSGAETRGEATTQPVALVVSAAAETASEAATLAAVFPLSATEVGDQVEAGTLTLAVTLSGAETAGDFATNVVHRVQIADSGSEARAESGSDTVVVSLSASEIVSVGETGLLTLVVALSGAEARAEAATQPVVFPLSASEARGDTGALTVALVLSANEGATEAASQIVVISLASTEAGAAATETGTLTLSIALSEGPMSRGETGSLGTVLVLTAAEARGELAGIALSALASGQEGVAEAATHALALLVSASETVGDSDVVVIVISPTEATSDAGTVVITFPGGPTLAVEHRHVGVILTTSAVAGPSVTVGGDALDVTDQLAEAGLTVGMRP